MRCVLCDIAVGAESATVIFQDDDLLAITPLREAAPTHILLFPREHHNDLPSYLETQPQSSGRLLQVASMIAAQHGLGQRGFRLVWNYGRDTAQRIMHPHLHLLGGRKLSEELG